MKLWDWLIKKPSEGTPGQKKPEKNELFATLVRDRYSSYPSKNLTPSRLSSILEMANLGACKEAAELFEEFEEKDPHIFSVLQTRKLAVLGCPYTITSYSDSPEDKAISEFVEKTIKSLPNFRGALLDLLDAIGKGYSASEIMWELRDGKVLPTSLNWIHSKNVTWINSIVPRIITEQEQSLGIVPPPWKVIMHLCRAKSGHDTRNGVLRVLSWMYLFKNYTVKDWVTFNEVFGMPIRVGKYDSGADPADITKLANAVKNRGADAAGIISKNTEIEFIESTRGSGRMNPYQMFIDFANREISKAVLGQTLTSDASGQTGTYSTAKIHEMVRQDILEADAEALSGTITDQLIRPLVGFNYPNGWNLPIPKFWIKAEAEDDAKETSEVLVNLDKIRFPIPLSFIRDRFGVPEAKAGEATTRDLTAIPLPVAAPPPVVDPEKPGDKKEDPDDPGEKEDPAAPAVPARNRILFALADSHIQVAGFHKRGADRQKELDVLLDNALEQNAVIMEKLLTPLKELINNGGSLTDIRDGLAKLYPQMPRMEQAELLFQAQMLAYMKGRLLP
jgi:phage gp29-like protein